MTHFALSADEQCIPLEKADMLSLSLTWKIECEASSLLGVHNVIGTPVVAARHNPETEDTEQSWSLSSPTMDVLVLSSM